MIPPPNAPPTTSEPTPRDDASPTPSEPAPTAPLPFDPDAPLFEQARTQFVEGRARSSGSLLLLVTLLLFVFSMSGGATPTSVAIVVGVLVVHELGHYLGMRAFGYRDVRMFFVPFFGAAVSGRRGNVAAWKDAIVLLLGPVPGVLLGIGVLLSTFRWPIPWLLEIGETLLAVNAFNLLPFGGLDGGKLLLRVVFARHRYLELAFSALGALALGALALALQAFALGFFAMMSLASLGRRARLLEAAVELAPDLADATPATLDETSTRRLFDRARSAIAPANDPRAIGTAMEEILTATQRSPGPLASFVLLATWALACLVSLVAAVSLAYVLGPATWARHALAVGSVELPDDPHVLDETWPTPAGPRTVSAARTALDVVEHFSAVTIDADADIAEGDRDAWTRAARDYLTREVADFGATPSTEQAIELAGHPATEITWRNTWRIWRARIVVIGAHEIVLVASSPDDGADARRFLESFSLDAPVTPAPSAPPGRP